MVVTLVGERAALPRLFLNWQEKLNTLKNLVVLRNAAMCSAINREHMRKDCKKIVPGFDLILGKEG